MAVLYVRSTDGNDADDGSTWALAKATIAGALAAAAAGDTIYVSQAHSFVAGAAITLTSPGVAGNPVKIICVNDAAEPPTAVALTGSEQTPNNGSITVLGHAYWRGLVFTSGDGFGTSANIIFASSSGAMSHVLESCKLTLNSSSSVFIGLGNQSTVIRSRGVLLKNCTYKFSAVGQSFIIASPALITGGSVDAAGTIPTSLFKGVSGYHGGGLVRVEGMDLSALGTGKSWVDVSFDCPSLVQFVNCKEGSGHTHVTGSIVGPNAMQVDVFNPNGYWAYRYEGEISPETTIVKTGGSTTSYKMTSSANANMCWPLRHEFGPVYWNEATGSPITIDVSIVTDGVTLTDAEAWIRVEYIGTSGQVVSSFADDAVADILATPANQASDTSTWTTTGLSSPVKQKLSVSVTPQEAGYIHVHVYLAKASTTMYCDALIRSGSRQYMLPMAGVVNDPASGGGTIILNSRGIKTGGQL